MLHSLNSNLISIRIQLAGRCILIRIDLRLISDVNTRPEIILPGTCILNLILNIKFSYLNVPSEIKWSFYSPIRNFISRHPSNVSMSNLYLLFRYHLNSLFKSSFLLHPQISRHRSLYLSCVIGYLVLFHIISFIRLSCKDPCFSYLRNPFK